MSQQSSGPAGPGSDQWPDGLWPDDDDDGAQLGAGAAPSMPPGWPDGGPRRGRLSPANLAVVAVVAVVIGAGIALAVQVFSGSPAASAPSSSQPSLGPGQQSGGNIQPGQGGGQPGQSGGFPGGQAGTARAFIVGTVLKVSATSITIGGPGHTITAAVTGSTRVSGKVTAIGGLKVGDHVSAQISETSSGKGTAVAIQYPAQLPAGGVPGG